MIEWIRKIIEQVVEWLKNAFKRHVEPPKPTEPPKLPQYIEELREGHPGMTDEELSKTVWLEALVDTRYYEPFILKNGEIYRNNNGFMVLKPMKRQHIEKGQLMEVYRWPFRVDGGVVRESRWKVEGDKKGLVNIKDISKPEE